MFQFLNSALSFVLGVDSSDHSTSAPLTADEFVKSFHKELQYSMFRVMVGPIWRLVPQKNYLNTCASAHSYIDYYIDQASKKWSTIKCRSLIRYLSAQTDDTIFIRSQVIQAMMAAQDTTSELLTNTLFLLARHSTYWNRLRDELAGRPEDVFSAENLLGSELIENILHESKRLKVE
jgi:cytochrome P450